MKGQQVALLLGVDRDPDTDTRVGRTLDSLHEAGFEPTLWAGAGAHPPYSPSNLSVQVVRVPLDGRAFSPLRQLLYNVILGLRISRGGYSAVHCNDFDTLGAGAIARILGRPRPATVYDAHEYESALTQQYKGTLASRLVVLLENLLLNISQASCITVNDALAQEFSRRGFRFEVVTNVPRFTEAPPLTEKTEVFTVVYAGNIKRDRGYDKLIQAVEILRHSRDDFKVIVLGRGRGFDAGYEDELQDEVAKAHLEPLIEFRGHVNHPHMMRMLAQAHMGLILFQPSPNNRMGLPNKLFEYLSCGLPVVAPDFPEMSKFVREHHCGLLVDTTDSGQIAQALDSAMSSRELYNSISSGAHSFLHELRENQPWDKLVAIYRSLLRPAAEPIRG